jgi:glutathione transport system substrate-binding protein
MNKLHSRRLSLSFLSVLVLAALTFSLVATPANAQGTKPIVVGLSGEPPNLDPHINAGTAARTVRLLIYRGLFNYSTEGVATPELVESYKVADDNVTYTFKLRDAKFHNGDPVTADDVKFSIERIQNPKTGATFIKLFEVIESVKAVDAKTVEIRLKSPTAPFIDYLALPNQPLFRRSGPNNSKGN